MDRDIDLEGLCPCGSGQLAMECCLQRDGRLVASRCRIKVSNQTAFQHRRCYASKLSGCSESKSNEHFLLPQSILRTLQRHRISLTVRGFPWQKPGEATRLTGTLKSGMLCGVHNSALEPLDEVGRRFLVVLMQVDDRLDAHSARQVTYLFNGHDVESWILKILCGLLASGIKEGSGKRVRIRPPEDWIRILYQLSPWPSDCGLYFTATVGDVLFGRGVYFDLETIVHEGKVWGLRLSLSGLSFILLMKPRWPGAVLGDGKGFRPRRLSFKGPADSIDLSVIFTWESSPEGLQATIPWHRIVTSSLREG